MWALLVADLPVSTVSVHSILAIRQRTHKRQVKSRGQVPIWSRKDARNDG